MPPTDTLHQYEGMSDLHRELASLRLRPEDLAAELRKGAAQQEEERRRGGRWQRVAGGGRWGSGGVA